MTSQEGLCRDPYKQIVFATCYIFAVISGIGLSLVLVEAFSKERKKSVIILCIVLISISEIINSLSKLLTIIRSVVSKETEQTVSNIQIVFSIYSDVSSLIVSLILSLKLQDLTKTDQSSKRKFNKNIILFVSVVIPLIIGLTLVSIDFYVFNVPSDFKNECKVWAWINRNLSLGLYGFVWIIIIIIIRINCQSISRVTLKVEMLTQNKKSKDTEESESNSNNQLIDTIISSNANKLILQIKYFPIVTCIIWGILSIDRISDDLALILEFNYSNYLPLEIFKQTTIFLHNLISSTRGLIYCVTFFRADKKLFIDVLKRISMICCCEPDMSHIKKKKIKNVEIGKNSLIVPKDFEDSNF